MKKLKAAPEGDVPSALFPQENLAPAPLPARVLEPFRSCLGL